MKKKIRYTNELQAIIEKVWREIVESTGIEVIEPMAIPQDDGLWATVEAIKVANASCVQVSLITRREKSALPAEKSENAAKLWDRDILWDCATQPYTGPDSEYILNGGYILVSTYADLNDEEYRALKDNDETPEGRVAVKLNFLKDYIKEDYGTLDDFFRNYTWDDVQDLFYDAGAEGAAAFEYRPGYPDAPFLFPLCSFGEGMLALADFLHRRLPPERTAMVMKRMCMDVKKEN